MERHAPLVSCETLFENLGRPDWVVFDCRYRLGEAEKGLKDYGKGHIPGARYAHIDRDLSGPVGNGSKGRHPLPIPGAFTRFLRTYGVGEDTQVVAYDDEGGWWASRLWWLCRDHGLRHVAVLDGGLTRWKALGLPLRAGHEPPARSSLLEATPGQMPVADVPAVERMLTDGGSGGTVVDVRAPERYRGETEPVDPVAGHIPGAINVPFSRSVAPDMRFLGPDELRAALEGQGVPSEEGAIVYCGSGVTATHAVLCFEVAGLPTPKLYAGSWSQWCRPAEERPVATGAEAGALERPAA